MLLTALVEVSINSRSDNKKNMRNAKTAKDVVAFVAGLVEAGVKIPQDEQGLLAERLVKSRDPERELIRLGLGRKHATVHFTVEGDSLDGKKLSKAFMDIGFDGYCHKDFLGLLKV